MSRGGNYMPKGNDTGYSGKNQNQNQQMKNMQKIVQDQNYSNQTFFIMLSSLQSVMNHYQNKGNQFKNKMFSSYDRVDYGSKSLKELKSQLSIHVFLFQNSKIMWMKENPHDEWRLPNNFNEQSARQFVNNAISIFRQNHDQESFKMATDILTLLDGRVTNLHNDNLKINVQYSQEQKNNYKKKIFDHGMQANQQMIRVGQEASKYENPQQLKARIKENSYLGYEVKNQVNKPYKNSQFPTNPMENNMPKTGYQPQKMELENGKNHTQSNCCEHNVNQKEQTYNYHNNMPNQNQHPHVQKGRTYDKTEQSYPPQQSFKTKRSYLFFHKNAQNIQEITLLALNILSTKYDFNCLEEWNSPKIETLKNKGFNKWVEVLINQHGVICQRGDLQLLY